MTAVEMKYALFRDIDSIEDESVLYKLTALVKSLLHVHPKASLSEEDKEGIPDFVRNLSVKTGLSGDVDAKELMHEHWSELYG